MAPAVEVDGTTEVMTGCCNCSVTPKGLLTVVNEPSVAVKV
jgi:hypothetical protein